MRIFGYFFVVGWLAGDLGWLAGGLHFFLVFFQHRTGEHFPWIFLILSILFSANQFLYLLDFVLFSVGFLAFLL